MRKQLALNGFDFKTRTLKYVRFDVKYFAITLKYEDSQP